MKTFAFSAASAAVFATLVAFTPVSAQADGQDSSSGHYEWRSAPQAGPRAPLRAPVRIWVSNHPGDNEQGVGGPYCDAANMGKPAHYEWLPSPQHGPRDTLRPPARVWVEC